MRTVTLVRSQTLIAVPLLGWIDASSRAWAVTLVGIVPLPALSAAGALRARRATRMRFAVPRTRPPAVTRDHVGT
ncbi:hypothetical protein WS89_00120 [Burkholderia sp. MSMB1072]|nr:hypothetical protein WS89_00120 [Burkholderia sp. MSMB1072]